MATATTAGERRDTTPLQRALDLLVFAPVGVALTVAEDLPGLIGKGRQRFETDSRTPASIGQFVVDQGQRELRRARRASCSIATRSRTTDAGRRRPMRPTRQAAARGSPGAVHTPASGTKARRPTRPTASSSRAPWPATTPSRPPRWSAGSRASGPTSCGRSTATRRHTAIAAPSSTAPTRFSKRLRPRRDRRRCGAACRRACTLRAAAAAPADARRPTGRSRHRTDAAPN